MWNEQRTIIGLLLAGANKGTSATPSIFKTYALAINPAKVYPGIEVMVTAQVTNTSDSESVYISGLSLDDETVEIKKITFAAGESKQVSFTGSLDNPGTYKITWTELVGEIVAPRITRELVVVGDSTAQSADPQGSITNLCR